jgi:hypothetical protein
MYPATATLAWAVVAKQCLESSSNSRVEWKLSSAALTPL